MQNEYANSTAFDFSNYDSSSEDEAAKPPKTTRKRSRCFEPTSSASLAAPTFHELHTVETSSTSTNLDFIIYGHPCMLHEDRNGFAKELEDEKNLIDVLDAECCDHEITYAATTTSSEERNQMNINDGDSMHLYVDKYDVRTLMTREDLLLMTNEDTYYRKNEEWDDDLTLEERKQLEELRFGDMYISGSSIRYQEHDDPKDEAVEREPKQSHLSDGSIDTSTIQTKNEQSTVAASDKKDEENSTNTIFVLEASIRSIIPANTTIPSTKRQFDIIQMTAKKSCDQPQFELFLKVKEETNPDFQFLSEKNELYPFYLAMKKSLETKPDKPSESRKKAIGLLDMYSSSSDEENEQESHIGVASIDEKVIKEEVSANAQSNTENSNELSKEEKRAMRLKKAKLLRHRFQQS
ncbi:hypothetical protein CTEN210_12249 [Chaetoceros tenuissimus]|uniref:SURP motif domain-containing protein n=1 Tax=Chaetoceros tenuissimus TaxID=426638 RepID=A0AAD3HAB3_9STRA|nr:hypothetical protein CTEN210_12249 [Chaetoceros tenuissimus]